MRGPRIEILDSSGRPKSLKAQEISYAVGDKIELRCNSAPSKPAARLRWYLNDHELILPGLAQNLASSEPTRPQSRANPQPGQFIQATSASNQPLGYDVRLTPIEFRQHYKGIYSSHSTLSLVLQQDDLVNSKISFKCLASMRQEAPIHSKQLIVLTPQPGTGALSLGARLRAKRFTSELMSLPDGDLSGHNRRHKAQYNRHGNTNRGSPQASSSSSSASRTAQHASLPIMSSDLINSLPEDSKNQLMYIYEDSDSTLGPSIIDSPETLDRYLNSNMTTTDQTASGGGNDQHAAPNNNYALEFNRADNLEYIQALRDRSSRQRSLPSSHPQTASGHKRTSFGSNSLVKSPLYLDENDPLRPIISWPPLESGKLMLLPPGQTIVAIPTQPSRHSAATSQNELRFVLPPRSDSTDSSQRVLSRVKPNSVEDPSILGQVVLERLIENLNCTCTEGSIDTKMGWIVNDVSLNSRDTRVFPTRISPDHRQTWITVGLQTNANPTSTAGSLQSILSQYYKTTDVSSLRPNQGGRSGALRQLDSRSQAATSSNNQPVPASNEQIRFICQAIHSMLLYSSSEMITFDFNPPPIDGNTIDKFQSLPSNVIQATSGKYWFLANYHGLFLLIMIATN